eukprot:1151627-Pelagomonas_calceolata.AAC.2
MVHMQQQCLAGNGLCNKAFPKSVKPTSVLQAGMGVCAGTCRNILMGAEPPVRKFGCSACWTLSANLASLKEKAIKTTRFIKKKPSVIALDC